MKATRYPPLLGSLVCLVVWGGLASCRHAPVEAPPTVAVVAPPVLSPVARPAVPDASPTDAEETPPPELVEFCRPGTPGHGAATARFSALDDAIRALPLAADPKPLAGDLRDLLGDPCFRLARMDARSLSLDFDSGLALRTFWDSGGYSWLHAALHLGDPDAKDRFSFVPPSPRRTLTTDTQPRHPLLPLLCPATAVKERGPGSCGHPSEGHLIRAAGALGRRPATHMPKVTTHTECDERTQAAPPGDAYAVWRDCMSFLDPRHDALPIGAFKQPTEGWLLLSGRRGHYGACEEERAYDLETGSAYVVKLCRSAVQGPAPRVVTETGSLPLAALREAAWMILLSDTADRNVVSPSSGYPLPEGMVVGRWTGRLGSSSVTGWGRHSGRTTLRAAWAVPERRGRATVGFLGQASTVVEWPDAGGPARDHATELLRIAEAGFQAGCPRAALPASFPWDDAPPVNRSTTPPALEGHEPLRAELARVRARARVCPR